MDFCRVIPCLDVKHGRLVKGVNFINLADVGDPAETGAAYSQAGADELVFLDITATLEGRKTLLEAVKRLPDSALAEGQFARGLLQICAFHDTEHTEDIQNWRKREGI